jgi:hypothetical protein
VDDIVIFAESRTKADIALMDMANILDNQQRLGLQRHKTKIYESKDIQELARHNYEDRALSPDENSLLNVIKKYSGGNPYATVTLNQISNDDLKAFDGGVITRILDAYIGKSEIDYIRLRWLFRRLAQVGHDSALAWAIDNIEILLPCLPSVCAYIQSLQSIKQDTWSQIGEKFIRLLTLDRVKASLFYQVSLLSLFNKVEGLNNIGKLIPLYESSDSFLKREIILAAVNNDASDWLRELKTTYNSFDPWCQSAYICASSMLPKEERRFFLKTVTTPAIAMKYIRKWAENA